MANNITELNYLGNVTVKINVCGKLYDITNHNEGLDYLKYIFSLLMTGNIGTNIFVPQYIDLRKEYTEEGEVKESSYLNYLSQISAKRYYKENNDWYAELTGVIDSDQLFQTVTPDDTSNYYLYLMTGYTDEHKSFDLARLSISSKTLSQITPGITATIVWSMKLTNA